MRNLPFILVVMLALGCASTGHPLDQSKIAQIKMGQTSREEVLKLLGKPNFVMADGTGNTTFQYVYGSATSQPQNFIPIVGAFSGGMDMHMEQFVVVFGPDNIVQNLVNNVSDTSAGHGD